MHAKQNEQRRMASGRSELLLNFIDTRLPGDEVLVPDHTIEQLEDILEERPSKCECLVSYAEARGRYLVPMDGGDPCNPRFLLRQRRDP